MPHSPTVLIAGAGLAAATTAQALRDNGYSGAVTVVGDEPHPPYERPPLSKTYLQGSSDRDALFVHPTAWWTEHDVTLLTGSGVTDIDRDAHRVRLVDGTRLPYDHLVLATGSTPRRLSVPGADLPGVHYLRRLDDSDRLRDTFARIRRLTVIGAGWIGLEATAAARAAGVDVTVLETAALPLLRVLGPEVAAFYAGLHRDHGVDLRTDVLVERLLGDHVVEAVQLVDGTRIDTDAVLVGVGILPTTALAERAGLDVDDGVVVDEHLRTSDPAVYAIGDVANAWHPVLRRRIRVEHWANALHQPAVAAANILGGAEAYRRLPYFYSDQYDVGMEYVGYAAPGDYDRVVFRGEPSSREFIAFWLRDAYVVAAMNVNTWDVNDTLRDLIADRRPVDIAALTDPDVSLRDVLPREPISGPRSP